jgi:hypothetical protein
MIWDFPKPKYKNVQIDQWSSRMVCTRRAWLRVIWTKTQHTIIVGSLLIDFRSVERTFDDEQTRPADPPGVLAGDAAHSVARGY